MTRFIQSSSPVQGTTTRLRADQARDAIRRMLQEHDPLQLPVCNLTSVGVHLVKLEEVFYDVHPDGHIFQLDSPVRP